MTDATSLSSPSWSVSERILFRFAFLFLILFIILFNNGAFPFFSLVMSWPEEGLTEFIPWFGKHVLQMPNDFERVFSGSGDTTFHYVQLAFVAMVSVVGTVLWSVLDRRRKSYNTLYYWLLTAIRFYVGLTLINYGMVKVIKLQFGYPSLGRLTDTYGSSSPMGLAWTFLGFSKGYNIFMGIAELCGVLLLFRRTMTLGVIITLMASANVMAVNYFYDVPVKIVSTALTVMSSVILLANSRQLLTFFFTSRPVSLVPVESPVKKRALKWTGIGVKVLLIGYTTVYAAIELQAATKEYGEHAPNPPLYGMYYAKSFVLDGDTLPPLSTDTVRWKKLIVSYPGWGMMYHMNDSLKWYSMEIDTLKKTLNMAWSRDSLERYTLTYEPVEKGLLLRGLYRGDSVFIDMGMIKHSTNQFRLMNRGFHWINEYPYNR